MSEKLRFQQRLTERGTKYRHKRAFPAGRKIMQPLYGQFLTGPPLSKDQYRTIRPRCPRHIFLKSQKGFRSSQSINNRTLHNLTIFRF